MDWGRVLKGLGLRVDANAQIKMARGNVARIVTLWVVLFVAVAAVYIWSPVGEDGKFRLALLFMAGGLILSIMCLVYADRNPQDSIETIHQWRSLGAVLDSKKSVIDTSATPIEKPPDLAIEHVEKDSDDEV